MASPNRSNYHWTDYLLGLLILVAAGVIIYPVTRYLQPRQTPPVFSGTLVPVSNTGELPEDQSIVIEYSGNPWILLHTEHGILALSNTCTYRGSELRWDKERSILVCAAHDCTFDHHGNVLTGLANKPLESLKVREVDGSIYVARRSY